MKKINLDVAATMKPKKEVVDYAINVMEELWYNPNSVYESALKARKEIEKARQIVAQKINANPDEIIFCPSASAANSLAILGFLRKNKDYKLAISNIEHDSIRMINIEKLILECNFKGIVESKELLDVKQSLISIQGANNEIGSIMNLKELCHVAHENGNIFHSDLTQYIPYFQVDVKELDLDMATFSAHKLGGLRGCAVLYVKNGIELEPLVYGHQELGLMAGTENTMAIASMGKALELLDYDNSYLYEIRDYLLVKLPYVQTAVQLNGGYVNTLPNNLNVCFPNIGMNSQQIISLLDMHGIEISAGSACNSGNNTPSHVLKAIGLSDEKINKSIRITFDKTITKDDIDYFVESLSYILQFG